MNSPETCTVDEPWRTIVDHLAATLPPQQFRTWIKPLQGSFTENGLQICGPNRFILNNFKKKYLPLVEDFVGMSGNAMPPVSFHLASAQKDDIVQPTIRHKIDPVPSPISVRCTDSIPPPAANDAGLLPAYTFEGLVEGQANRFAYANALQTANFPGRLYNPLFIFGTTGLGKTHLLHAIGNMARQRDPALRIAYVRSETYTRSVMKACRDEHELDSFRSRYQNLDILLVDDIQFIASKPRTQEEFFYTFNHLIEHGGQVVLSADTYPKNIKDMHDRLLSRFASGLIVGIEPPELEMRVAILLRKAESEKINLSDEAAFFIANAIPSNVRVLEGALKQVVARAHLLNATQSIDVASCQEALKDVLTSSNRNLTVETIQKTVADYYRIRLADIYSHSRSRTIARPRQLAMALARDLTKLSLPEIGRSFGGRDHSTVLHACKKIESLRAVDDTLNRDYALLVDTLRNT